MWTIIKAALAWLIARVVGPKEPTAVDLAASNATAQTTLAQSEAANAIQTKATGARADASDSVVRTIAEAPIGATAAAVNAELAKQHPDDFRD